LWTSLLPALLLAATLGGQQTAAQTPFADPAFQRVWERADRPVAEGRADRSWTWGPQPLAARPEPYKEAPGGQRQVQYFDKARMEINNPDGNRQDPFFVTNGRLVVELLSGRIQTGEEQYEPVLPAEIPLAGDTPGGSVETPTYATLAKVASIGGQGGRAPPETPGTSVRRTLNRAGTVGELMLDVEPDPRSAIAAYVPETGHNVPAAFWEFLHQRGPVYENGVYTEDRVVDWVFAFGYPLTEPYWITIRVGGQDYRVLFQAFERRVLTFNPANPAAFQVEMGNVGLHYQGWRYAAPPQGCAVAAEPDFGAVWSAQRVVASAIGCPTAPAAGANTSIQHFEHGMMLELNPDSRGTRGIYVLFEDGTFARYTDPYKTGDPATRNLNPPPGFHEPELGFNKVWFEMEGGRIRERLGWGTDKEVAAPGTRQRFQYGAMFFVGPTKQVLVLYELAPLAGPIGRWQMFDQP
jgi:hypothetical protein